MRKQFYFLSVLFYLIVQMSASSQDGYILVVGSSESDSSVVEILELAGFNERLRMLPEDWTIPVYLHQKNWIL